MSSISHSLVKFQSRQQLDLIQTLADAFPEIDPGIRPFGSRVLVQVRTPQSRTKGGILISDETKDTEKWNQQVAKVIATGPVAFRNRGTLEQWAEGGWAKPGDYVRVPKYGGDRWEVQYGTGDQAALFVLFNDLDLLGLVTTDPRNVRAFI